MPYNLLNKKQWLEELNRLSNTYVDFINELTGAENIDLDIILSKKYKSDGLVFTGQEIIDNIQKKLAGDTKYIFEFRVVDNKPIIKRKYRVSFDSNDGLQLEDTITIATIEDLKSKHVEALIKIEELKKEIDKKESENYAVFLELVNAKGGLYKYASDKKLILMLSKILKDLGVYDSDTGTQYSYEKLNRVNKSKVTSTLYNQVYK